MQEELLNKINSLQDEVTQNDEEIKSLKVEHEKVNNEKQEIERIKNDEIKELKKRIDDMSSEFAEMLKETLQKMNERIEAANSHWKEENDMNMLQRFEEMALGHK